MFVSRRFALTPLANLRFFILCPLIFGLTPFARSLFISLSLSFSLSHGYSFEFTPTFLVTQLGRKTRAGYKFHMPNKKMMLVITSV